MSDPDWLHLSTVMRAGEPLDASSDADARVLRLRAVRGAITVDADEPALIAEATRLLLAELMARNGLHDDDLVSALFTLTPDLSSEFPARAARDFGWSDVPILCAQEIAVPGALPRCLRVLLHVISPRSRATVQHVYLRGAAALRPDLGPTSSPAAPVGAAPDADGN